MTILLNNVSADTTSASFSSRGGQAIVNIRANNFGGATVEIQTASSQDTLSRFATLASGNFISDISVKLDYLPNGVEVRVELTGTTSATNGVFVDILQ